jgi:hypothetical protein
MQTSKEMQPLKGVFLLLMIGMLYAATNLTSIEIFFVSLLISVFMWRLDARIPLFGAFVFLICIPILIVLNESGVWRGAEVWAESVAVWVYYFLSIGVAKRVYESFAFQGSEERFSDVLDRLFATRLPESYSPYRQRAHERTSIPEAFRRAPALPHTRAESATAPRVTSATSARIARPRAPLAPRRTQKSAQASSTHPTHHRESDAEETMRAPMRARQMPLPPHRRTVVTRSASPRRQLKVHKDVSHITRKDVDHHGAIDTQEVLKKIYKLKI